MASEITVSLRLRVVKEASSIDDDFGDGGLQFTMNGTERIDNVISVGFASAEAIDLGDVATAGWCFLKNLDSTNFITVRMGSGGADVIKMKAGEPACFRLAGNTPYAIADTVACRMRVVILED